MSTYEREKLNVNGDTVNLRDAGSVRFDRAQSLTAAQQAQARDNIGAVSKAGDTMTGALVVPNMAVMSDQWPFYRMLDDNGAEIGHIRGDEEAHNIAFREPTPGTDFAYEDYFLPTPTIQSGSTYYNILTTKSPVAVSQGGTGVTGKSGTGTDLTAAENINIRGNSVVRKWGPFGVLALFFDTTDQIIAYDGVILTAAPGYRPDSEYNGFVCDSSGKGYPVYFSTDGTLRSRVALPAGEYYCCNIAFFTP